MNRIAERNTCALVAIVFGLLPVAVLAAEQPTAHTDLRPVAAWSLGTLDAGVVPDTAGRLPASIVGAPESVAGVEGPALKLDGMGDYATVAAADAIAFADAPFSIAAWINVYALDRGQQMIVAKTFTRPTSANGV
jgi:hypothetical protein